MYELVIVWATGDTDIYEYDAREDAEAGQENFLMAFGEQVQWAGIRRKMF